jgi:hypothetical protein
MKSECYFKNREKTGAALEKYTTLTREWGWPIAESKLDLYRRAVVAFSGTDDEATRRASHEDVYGHLRSYWGVARNGTLWEAPKVFDMLTNQCRACSRISGLILVTLADEQQQRAVVTCLKAMRGLKRFRSGNYPIMAVSKNLHFFNQRLWVIYDNEIVVKKVYRVFRRDWNSFYEGIATDPGDAGIRFYLAYLLWASHMIRNSHERLMDDFADWFVESARQEGRDAEDFRDELRLSFATAFEFVVIGAAHLEAAGVPCLCG